MVKWDEIAFPNANALKIELHYSTIAKKFAIVEF